MSWNHPIQDRIREAMASGELEMPEHLTGEKQDLSDYFATPEDIRLGYSILKNANFTPLEVQLLGERARLRAELEKESDPLKVSEFQQLLAAVNARLNLKHQQP